MSYEVRFTPAVDRQISKLPRAIRPKIIARAEALADNPRPHYAGHLRGDVRITIGGLTKVYHIDDRGTLIRLWYFLQTDVPIVEDFLSLQERKRRRGKAFAANPIAAQWAEGVSTWMTEAFGRSQGTVARINRGRWRYIAGLDLATDEKQIQIERTGGFAMREQQRAYATFDS